MHHDLDMLEEQTLFEQVFRVASNLTALSHTVVSCLGRLAITLIAIALIHLAYRYARYRFGTRIRADANKAIIITGATSGIGLLVAKRMYELGFTVFACYRNANRSGYTELKKLSKKHHSSGRAVCKPNPRLFLVNMDVCSEISIRDAQETIESKLNEHELRLHCLVNNAGVFAFSSFEWTDHKTISSILDTNLRGLLLVTRKFLLKIIQDKGRVLNVSSLSSTLPMKFLSVYGVTKSAIDYFSYCLDGELRGYGALCCNIRPADLLSATPIIFPTYKTMEELTADLNETEKVLYEESLHESQFVVHRALKERLENFGDDTRLMSAIYDSKIPNPEALKDLVASYGSKKVSSLARSLVWLLRRCASVVNEKKTRGYRYSWCF